MLSFSSKVELLFSVIVVILFGLFFYRKQNHACAMGGKISKPKIVWLCLAVYIYFPLINVFAFEKNIPQEFRFILLSVAILMWVRGIGELYLLYGVKKWSPKIGIGHNSVCLITIIGETIYFTNFIFKHNFYNLYLILVLISLCLVIDSFYAYKFRKIVHGRTKGVDGVWFADEEQEHFKRLNTITNQWNWVVAIILVFILWRNF